MRTLKEILDDAGCETMSYSGRGMGGKECLAVDFDGSISKLFANVLDALNENSDGDEVNEEIGTVANAFRGMRQDSMGLGSVIYFPRVPYEDA